MSSVKPEVQFRVQAASASSICKRVRIASHHAMWGKPSFPFCKLRKKGPESLSMMALSPVAVMADADRRAGEGYGFVTRVKIKYKTRTTAPRLRKRLCILHNACFMCTLWTNLLKPSWAGIICAQMPHTNLRQWRLGNYAWPFLFVCSSCHSDECWLLSLPDFSHVNGACCFLGHPWCDGKAGRHSSPGRLGRDYGTSRNQFHLLASSHPPPLSH